MPSQSDCECCWAIASGVCSREKRLKRAFSGAEACQQLCDDADHFLFSIKYSPLPHSSPSPSSTTSSPQCQPQAPTSSWSLTTSTSSTTTTAPSPFQAALNLPSTFPSSFLPLNSTHRPQNHPHRRPRSYQPNQSRCATNHARRHRHRRPRPRNLHDRQSGSISNLAGLATMKSISRPCQKRRASVRQHRYRSSATPARARVTMMRKSKMA